LEFPRRRNRIPLRSPRTSDYFRRTGATCTHSGLHGSRGDDRPLAAPAEAYLASNESFGKVVLEAI
jgi:hypothetical protein